MMRPRVADRCVAALGIGIIGHFEYIAGGRCDPAVGHDFQEGNSLLAGCPGSTWPQRLLRYRFRGASSGSSAPFGPDSSRYHDRIQQQRRPGGIVQLSQGLNRRQAELRSARLRPSCRTTGKTAASRRSPGTSAGTCRAGGRRFKAANSDSGHFAARHATALADSRSKQGVSVGLKLLDQQRKAGRLPGDNCTKRAAARTCLGTSAWRTTSYSDTAKARWSRTNNRSAEVRQASAAAKRAWPRRP